MSIRLVRESSETPNITNKDDARMIRYAYGGKNGVIQSYGQELAAASSGNSITLNRGRVVVQGWEVDIEDEGWSMTVPSTAGTLYYVVYLEVNLTTETAQIKSSYLTGSYPDVDLGDDLTAFPSGTARLLLYRFTAQSGLIQNVQPMFSMIKYLQDEVEQIEVKFKQFEKGIEDGLTPILGGYDETKGTVEERLTRLGFKEGRITEWSTVVSTEQGVNNIKRQGNYCILNWWIRPANIVTGDILTNTQGVGIGTIPAEFSPLEEDKEVLCFAQVDLDGGLSYCEVALKKNPDDGRFAVFLQKLRVWSNLQQKIERVNLVNFGYEAKPL